jgi:hypothetical protein
MQGRSKRRDRPRLGCPQLGAADMGVRKGRTGFDPKRLSAVQIFCVAKTATNPSATFGGLMSCEDLKTQPLDGFCYSISSSARASNFSGISSLRTLAVARLKTNSYLVGNSTGNSLTLLPFRIRPT